MKSIILASASPRRRELLSEIEDSFRIVLAETDETLPSGTHPKDGVGILAIRKGAAVLEKMRSEGEATDGMIILSADTLVEIDGEPLGKPSDRDEARQMLARLSGRWHNVHTGVAVHGDGRVIAEVATTAVLFKELSSSEIEDYIDSGEPMDKAGSYGIQGLGGRFVERIDGDFDTVVGLSMKTTSKLLLELGWKSVDRGE